MSFSLLLKRLIQRGSNMRQTRQFVGIVAGTGVSAASITAVKAPSEAVDASIITALRLPLVAKDK